MKITELIELVGSSSPDVLSPREKAIVEYRIGRKDGSRKSQREIGRKLGVSGEMIRQYEKAIAEKLRHENRN